jgi:hypothetical protein
MEAIREAAPEARLWFQAYLYKDRELVRTRAPETTDRFAGCLGKLAIRLELLKPDLEDRVENALDRFREEIRKVDVVSRGASRDSGCRARTARR